MGSLLKLAFSACTGGIGSLFTSIIPWLFKHWRLALAVLALAGAFATYEVITHQRDAARAQVAADAQTIHTLTDQVSALTEAQATLEQAIAKQNSSIVGLKADGDAARARAVAAMKAADDRAKKDATTIASLRKRAIDPSNTGTCDAELNRIRAGL